MSLDHIIWSALASHHAQLARGGALVRRYPAEYAPFAALAEDSPAAWAALAELVPAGDLVVMFSPAPIVVPPGPLVAQVDLADQMMGPARSTRALRVGVEIGELAEADAPAMRALVELTNPGPFRARTHELGRFFGIRDPGGALIAMAGERMHLTGFTEISGVCVHPAHRGHGYADVLIQRVSDLIVARGETPMLHVMSANASAIALYHKLGFTRRAVHHLAMVTRAA